MMDENINNLLKKDTEIEVLTDDLLYQEAILEYLQKNEVIDFILLNEELPGEEIENFINKIENIKIILFTKFPKKQIKNNKIYKQFTIGEKTVEEIIKIIKNEDNYVEELEKEIQKLKKELENKKNNNLKTIREKFIKKTQKINEKNKNKIIAITRKQSYRERNFFILLVKRNK